MATLNASQQTAQTSFRKLNKLPYNSRSIHHVLMSNVEDGLFAIITFLALLTMKSSIVIKINHTHSIEFHIYIYIYKQIMHT